MNERYDCFTRIIEVLKKYFILFFPEVDLK